MTSKISETSFKVRVLRDLKALKATYVLKTQERGRRGVPDVLMCYRGFFVAIELKREGKTPDPLQTVKIQEIREAGGLAFYTTPDVWDGHLQMIKAHVCGRG